MKRKTIFKIITIAFGLFLGLLLAEVAYRIFHFISYRDLKDIVIGNRPPIVSPNKELILGQVIQVSPNRRIVYELIPSSRYRFQNALVQTNSLGFRDREYPLNLTKDKRKIVGLGDSVMFGWGVDEHDCYLTVMEDFLNQHDSAVFEVVNTGVPGYNTVMEVETLKEKFDLNAVDMVILNFVGNDLDLPNFIQKKPAYLGIKKSLILQRFDDNDGLDKHLKAAPFNEKSRSYRQSMDKVPTEYRDMVGEASFVAAMDTLKHLKDKYCFEVLILSTDPDAPAPDFVRVNCDKFGFILVEIMPKWRDYTSRNSEATWSLSSNDKHPSVLGHKIIATVLAETILGFH